MNYKIDREKLSVLVIALVALSVVFGFTKLASAPEGKIAKMMQSNNNGDNKPGEAIVPKPEEEINLVFTGDIMLSRTVNAKMEKYNDYNWPFKEVSGFLNEADIVVGNLESPFLKNSKSYQVLTGSFSFKANPLAVEGLKLANFSVLSLANNHSINQGKQGIIDTRDILEKNEIKFLGAGLNEKEARKAEILKVKDHDFAFLAYAYPQDYSVATDNRAGIADMDIVKMREDIESLKELDHVPELIVVLMHAGSEYVLEPNWQQKAFAKAAIEAGADLVVGHHPHWPQIFDFYQEKPIIYSLGNFVFDQMWSKETRQGLLLKVIWQDGIKSLELIPSKIYDYGQVRILSKEIEEENKEREEILTRIKANISGIIYERE